jgi:hypothetical protein
MLPCDLTELWLALWTLLVVVTNGVHNHLCLDARAITVDLVGKFVVYEKEDHKVTANSSTV